MKGTPARRLLIVDDEEPIRAFLGDLFRASGWDVAEADSGSAGIEKLERQGFDVVLTDLKMPGADGIELLRASKDLHPDTEVVLMTGYGSVDTAIEAMRAGAFHYLTKPFKAEEVQNLVEKAYAQRHLKRENLFLKAGSRGEHHIQAVVGTSPPLQKVVESIQRLADTDTPVLLVGERGTGKKFFGRVIHFQSPRAGGLFVPVGCAGVPPDVLESDLFGHAAGAYPEAVLPRAGRVEMADQGTLCLSGILEAGPAIQERLVRLIEARTLVPVGSDREIRVDARIVATTEGDPGEAAERGRFLPALRDLFTPGTIRVPALRERADDIPLLLHHFLYELNRERKKPLRGFSESALAAIVACAWPGNVRDLKELVVSIAERKKQGTIVDAADLPPDVFYGRRRRVPARERMPPPTAGMGESIERIERPMVLQALALAEGSRERAAELLSVDLATFEELIRRHRIDQEA